MSRAAIKGPRRLGLTPRGWTAVGVLLIVVLLELSPRIGLIESFSLPPLSRIVMHAGELAIDAEFWSTDMLPTLIAVAWSFALASIGGVLLGLLLWRFRILRRILDPWLAIYYAIPTFALYPLLIVIVGVGIVPIVLLGTLLAVVAVVTATLDGLDSTPRITLRLGESLQLSPFKRTIKILLPSAVEQISVGLRLGLSFSFIGVLSSEFILSTHGLGHFISNAYNHFALADMYAGILLVLLLALGVNFAFGALARRRTRRIFA